MSNKFELAICFATYNSSQYLNDFYEMLLAQNLKNYEVIVVDDGSHDNSVEISIAWSNKFENFKLITQKNSGLSVARNVGIESCNSKYIVLPDPDDIIYPNTYSEIFNIALVNNLDLCMHNGNYHYSNGTLKKAIFSDNIISTSVINGQMLFLKLYDNRFLHTTWLNIYKVDFLHNNKFLFYPGLLHQDILWTTQVLLKASRTMYLSKKLYGYKLRDGSATRGINSDLKNFLSVRNYIEIIYRLNLIIYKSYFVNKKCEIKFKSQLMSEYKNIKRALNRFNDKEYKNLACNLISKNHTLLTIYRNTPFHIFLKFFIRNFYQFLMYALYKIR